MAVNQGAQNGVPDIVLLGHTLVHDGEDSIGGIWAPWPHAVGLVSVCRDLQPNKPFGVRQFWVEHRKLAPIVEGRQLKDWNESQNRHWCEQVPHRADGLRYVRVTQGWNQLAAEAVDLPGPCVQGEHVTSVPEELHVPADPS